MFLKQLNINTKPNWYKPLSNALYSSLCCNGMSFLLETLTWRIQKISKKNKQINMHLLAKLFEVMLFNLTQDDALQTTS